MAGFITMAQAISGAVGGVPVQPASGQTIIEKLRAAKSMMPGDMGGLLSKVLSDGPGAILQNPVSGLLGNLQGQLGAMLGPLQNLASEGIPTQLLTSISGPGGMLPALTNLTGATNALSGLGGQTPGGFSLINVVGHANIIGMLGPNMPSGLGLNTVMGPILMGPNLQAMSTSVARIADDVVSGALNDDTASAQIMAMTGQINAVMDASDGALATVMNSMVSIAETNAVISLIASGPAEFAPIANMLIREDQKPEIQASLAEQIRV